MKLVTYNKKQDILFIPNGFTKNEKFKSNIDIGDLILDVSTKGKIKGIEIMEASKFLGEWVKKTDLKNLSDATFKAVIKPNSILISICLVSNNQEIPAKIAVPIKSSFKPKPL